MTFYFVFVLFTYVFVSFVNAALLVEEYVYIIMMGV